MKIYVTWTLQHMLCEISLNSLLTRCVIPCVVTKNSHENSMITVFSIEFRELTQLFVYDEGNMYIRILNTFQLTCHDNRRHHSKYCISLPIVQTEFDNNIWSSGMCKESICTYGTSLEQYNENSLLFWTEGTVWPFY